MPTPTGNLTTWIRKSLRTDPPRSKSLIITIFGDSLLPYVSGVWLSELIQLLQPFGVNGQLTRTSSFRLAEEGWLQSQRKGRTSWYSLTASGYQRIEHAAVRIYAAPASDWDGNWTVVALGRDADRLPALSELRRELEWEGFGRLAPKILLHPHPNMDTLHEMISRLGVVDAVVLLRARDLDNFAPRSDSAFPSEGWNLDQVRESYKSFLQRFAPVLPLAESGASPEEAFVLQTLLTHSFRRVVLHDPRLPAALLPPDWPGHDAYELCRRIYLHTHALVRQHLTEHLVGARTGVLTSRPDFRRRLGGLD